MANVKVPLFVLLLMARPVNHSGTMESLSGLLKNNKELRLIVEKSEWIVVSSISNDNFD